MSNCWSYCSHGGICVLEAGHEGLHDSEYCQWADAEALTKDAADAVFRRKGGDVAEVILLASDLMLGLAGEERG
jgi:hypothetical protein